MREFSKKIVYSGDPSNYNAWADAMWARGFNTSQEDVMNLLSVSRNWVVLTLLNEIPYVTYSYMLNPEKRNGSSASSVCRSTSAVRFTIIEDSSCSCHETPA